MMAKCPHCDDGCDKCEGGFVDVTFASKDVGHYHSIICNQCDRSVGGVLHCENDSSPTVSQYAICPWCGTRDLRITDCKEDT